MTDGRAAGAAEERPEAEPVGNIQPTLFQPEPTKQ